MGRDISAPQDSIHLKAKEVERESQLPMILLSCKPYTKQVLQVDPRRSGKGHPRESSHRDHKSIPLENAP